MERYDLVVLGQGAAAFAGAIRADELGVKTLMIGWNATPGTLIGGTCVNVGCMPSKRMITVGTTYNQALGGYFEGIEYGSMKLDYKRVVEEKDRLIERFRREKYADVLERLENVTYIEGKGRFISKNSAEVNGEAVEGKKFLVAVGARANIIPVEGLGEVDYLTNEEALNLKELPESLCVIGGRALGLEFAQMFAQFGTDVTI
ncbi:MAG: FAD-dependent oxidoreductase, partial [Candidatus Hydrothermarchaeales archaeon]